MSRWAETGRRPLFEAFRLAPPIYDLGPGIRRDKQRRTGPNAFVTIAPISRAAAKLEQWRKTST